MQAGGQWTQVVLPPRHEKCEADSHRSYGGGLPRQVEVDEKFEADSHHSYDDALSTGASLPSMWDQSEQDSD